MTQKISRRILSLLLTITMLSTYLLYIDPIYVNSKESYDTKKASFQIMAIKETGGYAENGEPVEKNVLLYDSCLLVDLFWIAEKLNLSITTAESPHLLSDKISNYLTENSTIESNYYTEMLDGYQTAFSDTQKGTEFKISKSDSFLYFFFREGSDKVYAYSPYLGNISTTLGAPLTKTTSKDGKTTYWVPIVMFLNLFDGFASAENGNIYIYPGAETAIDILHKNNLDEYYFDVFEDSGFSDFDLGLGTFYNNFYNIIKQLFHGVVSLDPSEIISAFSPDEKFAELIAQQICTYSSDELNEFDKLGATLGDSISVALSTASNFAEEVNNAAWDDAAYLLEESERLFGKSGYEALNSWNDAVKKAQEAALDAKAATKLYRAFADAIPYVNVVLSTYFEYVTLTNEISATESSRVSALKTFLSYTPKIDTMLSSNTFIDSLKSKARLYDGKNKNLFENDELLNQTVENITSNAAVEEIGASLSTFSKFLLKFQIVSLGWDIAEILINETLGTFDALDCLQCALYVQVLQNDTDAALNYYLCHEIHPDNIATYRNLEWMRLMSFYLVRQEVIGAYQAKTRFEESVSFPFDSEMDELAHYMVTLMMGPEGVTQSALDDVYAHLDATNQQLVDSTSFSTGLTADQLTWLVEPTWDYEVVEPIPTDEFSPTIGKYSEGQTPLFPDYVFPFSEMSDTCYSNLPEYYNVKKAESDWYVFHMPTQKTYASVSNAIHDSAMGIGVGDPNKEFHSGDLASPWDPLFCTGYGSPDLHLYWDTNSDQAYGYHNGYGGMESTGEGQLTFRNLQEFGLHKPYPIQQIDLHTIRDIVGEDLTWTWDEIPPESIKVEPTSELYAYISPNGELITDFVYQKAGAFSNGIAACSKDGKTWGYIDEAGNLATDFLYEPVWNLDSQWGFPYAQPQAFPCTDDTMVVKQNGKYGLLYRDGSVLIGFGEFESLSPSWNHQLWAKQDGKWGLIDLADAKEKANLPETKEDPIEESPVDSVECLIERDDRSIYNDQGDRIFNIYFDTVTVQGNTSVCEKINQQLEQDRDDYFTKIDPFVQEKIPEAEQFYDRFGEYKYSATAEIMSSKDGVLSVRWNIQTYQGGAHGGNGTDISNFSLKTGEKLELEDMFSIKGTELRSYLRQQCLDYIAQHPDGGWSEYLYNPVLNQNQLEKYPFYIQDGTVYLQFAQYELADGAAGTVSIPCPVV